MTTKSRYEDSDVVAKRAINASANEQQPVELMHGQDGSYSALCDELALTCSRSACFDDVSSFYGETNGLPWTVIVRSIPKLPEGASFTPAYRYTFIRGHAC